MGFEIGIAWLSVLLFGSLGLLLMLGLPMAFCTGSLAVIFLYVFGSGAILNMLPSRIFPFMTDYQLSAVPLFIFMAAMLEKAGIIEELFDAVYKWLGAVKGGLAAATVLACTALAAMVGVVGARGAGQRAREIAAAQQYDRALVSDLLGARDHLHRHRHPGRSRRHRHLRRAVRLGAAPPPDLARDRRSRHRHVEGDGDGDVD